MNKFKKKYKVQKDLLVYPSILPTIEADETDGLGGISRYRVMLSDGFKGSHSYINKKENITFLHKDKNGKIKAGLQSQQLALILLDRTRKLNKIKPSPNNDKKIKGLEMFLDAFNDIIDENINGK